MFMADVSALVLLLYCFGVGSRSPVKFNGSAVIRQIKFVHWSIFPNDRISFDVEVDFCLAFDAGDSIKYTCFNSVWRKYGVNIQCKFKCRLFLNRKTKWTHFLSLVAHYSRFCVRFFDELPNCLSFGNFSHTAHILHDHFFLNEGPYVAGNLPAYF